MRVGSQLQQCQFWYDKNPRILFTNKHHLAKVIVIHEHSRLLHAGPKLLLSSLYWIASARVLLKKIVHEYVRCPIMAYLPPDIVKPSASFLYCGAFHGVRQQESELRMYQVFFMFISFSTKAVHLELVADMSTETVRCTPWKTLKNLLEQQDQFYSRWFRTTWIIPESNFNSEISCHFILTHSSRFDGLWRGSD